MKRSIFAVSVLALSVTILAGYLISCGGGGGGGAGWLGGGGTGAPATGTFTKNVAYTGGFSAEDQFSTTAGSRYQSLYLARDMKGAGMITSISYKYWFNAVATAVSCPNVTMKMGHTQSNSLSSTFANNVENGVGSLKTVINSAPVTILPGSAGSYYTISLATPFYYNGVDNLVVEVSRGAACTAEIGTVANVASPSYNGTLRSDQSPNALTGITNNVVLDTVFTFSGGDDKVSFGGTSLNSVPFRTTTDHVQMLYLASEINGSGPITGIGFEIGMLTTGGTYTYKVELAHTTVSMLSPTFADNYDSGAPTQVASMATLTIPAGMPEGSYIWVPLTGSFAYNGTSNLIVDIDVSYGSANTVFRVAGTTHGRRIVGRTGATYTTSRDSVTYHALFRFNGGTMDVIGADNGSSSVFDTVTGGRQFLVLASELGTAGSINKLACRLYGASTTTTYQNFTVTLAQTGRGTLATTDATNVAGGTKVYDGPFTVPGGLRAGDWVEIPFTAAFSYNGTSNLVIQTTTAGGSAVQSCQVSGPDAILFQDRYKMTGSAPGDYRGNFRFWMDK